MVGSYDEAAPVTDPWDWTVTATLPSRRGAHLKLMDEVLQRISNLGWEGRDFFGVQMALEESLTNAIRHGNKLDESKVVTVECRVSRDRFYLSVCDQGEGFRPTTVADCTSDEGLHACGGRGMMLINTYMDEVAHNEVGNCITMTKVRTAPKQQS